jgi:hypothetical protein
MFLSKNIVQTSMREYVFGTFAQMKHAPRASNNALMCEIVIYVTNVENDPLLYER